MTYRKIRTSAPALAIVLLCVFIAQSAAGDNRLQLQKDKKLRFPVKPAASFTVSGTFSGELDGSIHVGGRDILITKKTAMHRVGVGSLKKGTPVSNVFLFVAGSIQKGVPTASMILVRSTKGTGEWMNVSREKAKCRIPSESNPKVGELTRKAPE